MGAQCCSSSKKQQQKIKKSVREKSYTEEQKPKKMSEQLTSLKTLTYQQAKVQTPEEFFRDQFEIRFIDSEQRYQKYDNKYYVSYVETLILKDKTTENKNDIAQDLEFLNMKLGKMVQSICKQWDSKKQYVHKKMSIEDELILGIQKDSGLNKNIERDFKQKSKQAAQRFQYYLLKNYYQDFIDEDYVENLVMEKIFDDNINIQQLEIFKMQFQEINNRQKQHKWEQNAIIQIAKKRQSQK